MLTIGIAFGFTCLGGLYAWGRGSGRLDGYARHLGCDAGLRLYIEILLWTQFTGVPFTFAALSLYLRLKGAG